MIVRGFEEHEECNIRVRNAELFCTSKEVRNPVILPLSKGEAMDLKILSDEKLHENTICAAKREQEATLVTLNHLAEVERRRLHSKLGFASLFDYVVNALRFSEPAASQRIQAMRLMKSVPLAREMIESGTLKLSQAASLQKFIKQEEKISPVSQEKKEALLQRISGQSFRKAQALLMAQSSQPEKHQESQRPIGANRTELKFTIDEQTREQLERIRELKGNLSLEELFTQAVNSYLKQIEPKKPSTQAERFPKTSESESFSRYIPKPLLHQLLVRSQGRCEFVSPITKKRCESRYRLQIDHIQPLALGGTTTDNNLRHLCPSHHAYETVRVFGIRRTG